jgi:ketosteroid isomerase-like protein
MKRKYAAFGISAPFVFVMLGSAWPQSDEPLKKLETDRAAAAVKGDVATLEKQTADDYTFINLYGRMSDKSQMVNAFKTGQTKLTSNEVSDMNVRLYGDTAVITGKADIKGTLGGKGVAGQIMFTRVYVKKGGVAVSRVSTDSRLEPLSKSRAVSATLGPFFPPMTTHLSPAPTSEQKSRIIPGPSSAVLPLFTAPIFGN